MTPTSGGRATGNATSAPKIRRPGKSVRSKRKPRGTPTSAEKNTDSAEIQKLRHSASHSWLREKKVPK